MSQFTAPTVRRTGGDVNVYTGLLVVAFLVLVGGLVMLALRNIEHSKDGQQGGGVMTLVE